jgi:hypothetical protein
MFYPTGQVCQTEDYFDCYPAVQAAFQYAKVFGNGGVDENEELKKAAGTEEEKDVKAKEETLEEKATKGKVETSLDYSLFRVFLAALRQYFIYCQVASVTSLSALLCQIFRNSDVNPEKKIKKKKFVDPDNVAELENFVGAGLDMAAQFDAIDTDGKGKVVV